MKSTLAAATLALATLVAAGLAAPAFAYDGANCQATILPS
jgi:hypothetical protein